MSKTVRTGIVTESGIATAAMSASASDRRRIVSATGTPTAIATVTVTVQEILTGPSGMVRMVPQVQVEAAAVARAEGEAVADDRAVAATLIRIPRRAIGR